VSRLQTIEEATNANVLTSKLGRVLPEEEEGQAREGEHIYEHVKRLELLQQRTDRLGVEAGSDAHNVR
jgi:hypothetical protein